MATEWSQPGGFGPYDDVLTDYVNTLNAATVAIDEVVATCFPQLVRGVASRRVIRLLRSVTPVRACVAPSLPAADEHDD
jgi:hypothetical protein